MSNASEEPGAGSGPDGEAGTTGPESIDEEQLPEDLQRGEGNPLVEPIEEDERRDDLGVGAPDPTERLGDGPQPSGPDGE